MSEHLSHDLPDYVPNVSHARRAKVYKAGAYWTWHHDCGRRTPGMECMGWPFAKQASALRFALSHMKRCL